MDSVANFRNATISEPRVFGPQQQGIQTALGRVPVTNTSSSIQNRATQNMGAPPVPPKPYSNTQQSSMYGSPMGMYSNSYMGSAYSPYGMNPYGMSRYGMYGGGMYGGGGGMGMYGNQMRDPLDPESRFIQLAEESSRPAFQSIESLVMAIGNIAAMLDSTFFALTSSFRAILGVAANVGQLRGVFAQFWSTFALIRGVTWLYRKLLYLLGFSKVDPSTARFNEIFSAAAKGTQLPGTSDASPPKKVSAWPILTFLSLIFATPYLIMKLIGQVSTTAIEESRNPQTWVKPYAGEAVYNYKATSPHELSIYAGQLIQLAPREVQQTHKLLNTGWALATVDDKTSGLVPINYVRRVEAKQFATPSQAAATESEAAIVNQPDINIAAPEIPCEHVMEKDAEPIQSNFIETNRQMYDNKLPSNEIINESTHIDPVILDDIKDL
ncbi:peroxisomal membrane protein PEX13 [Sitodiplosis mosellana]|uniref:peroxisomal membrane protein PEX13 n=1 Tax=Sitodiplosis mosellana TaxID=263140 RepID=UPI002443AE32|nr:peroxisomal membrane protein PEX13 [Sitodiplosis mosellana]XP_055312892.1 peroxisomal membrane protein PEX13 [Sitodiplosis mosellana]